MLSVTTNIVMAQRGCLYADVLLRSHALTQPVVVCVPKEKDSLDFDPSSSTFDVFVCVQRFWHIWTNPYLTFGVGRLLHLPSSEAVSVRPNAQPRCNQKVTVIGCEAETSAVRPKSALKPKNHQPPGTGDVWLFLSGGLLLVSSSPSD